MKLTTNMYTISYSVFMLKNKEKYRLKNAEQVDIFYKAIFLYIVQMTFIMTILGFSEFDTTYKNNTAVNLCLFFTVLILHW